MNVTVINKKDLIKYLVVLITSIIVIVSATRFFYRKSNINDNIYITFIENTISLFGFNKENFTTNKVVEENQDGNFFTKIIEHEISIISNTPIDKKLATNDIKETNNTINIDNNEISNNISETENTNNNEEIELAHANVSTKVVSENNITPSYSVDIDGIQVKNQSSYEITNELINTPLSIDNTSDIMIFHTHTCESYTSSEKYNYVPTGNYRTTDKGYSVVRVGDELSKYLKEYGFNIIHDTTYHDYPAYTGSYDRSLNTVKGILETYPETDIVIDLHRDAVGSSSEYGPSVMIGDEKAAQLMFVIGTDGGGLYHPNWRKNLSFAVAVQKKANEMYPGLFRPIILRDSRYNHHLAEAACIIEVGATGNTLDECLVSMKYLSNVLNEALK